MGLLRFITIAAFLSIVMKMRFLVLHVKNIQVLEEGPEGPLRAARRLRLALDEYRHTNAVVCFLFSFFVLAFVSTLNSLIMLRLRLRIE